MLVWGISNPEGVDHEQSVYLTKTDVHEMARQIEDASVKGQCIPVKLEHKGVDVGRVISAWEFDGRLECVLDVNEEVFEGSLTKEFIQQGITKDLSLGYEVSFSNSKKMQVKKKHLKEISIVKKGARKNCRILGVK